MESTMQHTKNLVPTKSQRLEMILRRAQEQAKSADQAKINLLNDKMNNNENFLPDAIQLANLIEAKIQDPQVKKYVQDLILSHESFVSLLRELTEINPNKSMLFSPEPKRPDKKYVLVVEDQAIASLAIKNTLSSLGCQVDIAVDGKTTMRLIQEKDYDLIFMDIGLADSNGCEVVKCIRLLQLSKGVQVPIVALTAHIDEENRRRCLEAGMNAVLSKPLYKDKAREILDTFVAQDQQKIENRTKV